MNEEHFEESLHKLLHVAMKTFNGGALDDTSIPITHVMTTFVYLLEIACQRDIPPRGVTK